MGERAVFDVVIAEDGTATVPGLWQKRLLLTYIGTGVTALLLGALAVGPLLFRPHMRILVGQRRRHGEPIRARLAAASAARKARRKPQPG